MTIGDIRSAILELQAKEKAFLNGRKIAALPASDLTVFHSLLDVENALVLKELSELGTVQFWDRLVNDVLPTLITVAKIVIPILI